MKTVLTFTWWVGILVAIRAKAEHGTNGMFQQGRSPTAPRRAPTHHTKRADTFSSIFVGESVSTGGISSGFQPVGKATQAIPENTSTASPTIPSDGRRKGDKDPVVPPTPSPTFYETLSAVEVEDDVDINRPVRQRATVVSESRTIQLKGAFDPRDSEENIFEATESLMKTYMSTYGGDVIQSFELSLVFMHEYDHLTSLRGSPIMIMYFDVDVVFYITSYDMEEIADFSRNKATKLVERFFSGTHLTRWKRRLSVKGLVVQDAQLLSSMPANIPRSATGDRYQQANPQVARKSGAKTFMYAAMASAAIILFALVCVIIVSKREIRKSIKTVLGSHADSKSSYSYSDSSASSTVSGGIQPAALHIRRKREEEQARQADTSSLDGFSYTDRNFGSTFVRSHQPFLFSSRLGAKPRETDFMDDDDDESLDRLEDGLVASGALTCLDQERSEISSDYPEFEVFAHIPRQILEAKPKLPVPPSSPVWSVSATSYDIGSTAEDGDYAEQRRRWQDQQLDDLALVALPDHTSDKGSDSQASTRSSYDKSDDDRSKSTRNSSSASESSGVLPGLRREDEI